MHFSIRCSALIVKFFENYRDGVRFSINLHVTLSKFEPLLQKFKYFITALIKVAPRIEKTEVFRKGRNCANRTYFASCMMRKHLFLLWTKETAFFLYFYHGIILYSSKGLVTHNYILKIHRVIQYSKNIFKCNLVKNILKIYKKITFLLLKIIYV